MRRFLLIDRVILALFPWMTVSCPMLVLSAVSQAQEVSVYSSPLSNVRSTYYAAAVSDTVGQRHQAHVYQSRNAFRDYPQYPTSDFVAGNNHWASIESLPELFRRSGYVTWAGGNLIRAPMGAERMRCAWSNSSTATSDS
jgi:Ni/Co efflux regulator RcnB